ncbi:unnamed protein product [Allacma fusca]|uniref:Uncharacterized protein n=1 Tax=Allacma fusca TaxID=39272 RepID=A0A8J2PA87_9HEXA|nr:unnamed protein product [Allacma fusca]
MNKVATLFIYDLNGKSCRQNLRNNSNEFSIESNHSSGGISEAGDLQLGRLPMGKLESNECRQGDITDTKWDILTADIRHFLSIMENLKVLCIDKLVGKLCGYSFEENF